jgi:hypothetical protein
MEDYAKVHALSSTNKAAESYIAHSTTQPSVAPPVTKEELKQKEEKKHADLIKLVKCLHYYFVANPKNTSIQLSALIKAVGSGNQMLLSSNYKELCLAVPSWIKLKCTKNETLLVLQQPSFTADVVIKLIDLHFKGVAKKLQVERSTS